MVYSRTMHTLGLAVEYLALAGGVIIIGAGSVYSCMSDGGRNKNKDAAPAQSSPSLISPSFETTQKPESECERSRREAYAVFLEQGYHFDTNSEVGEAQWRARYLESRGYDVVIHEKAFGHRHYESKPNPLERAILVRKK